MRGPAWRGRALVVAPGALLAVGTLVAPGGAAGARGVAQDGPVDVGLDPGHSDADVGAAGGGLREVDLTLALALRIRPRWRRRGCGSR